MIKFNNKGDKLSELFKDRPIRILDLRSIGYYKVNYQRLIAMAEEKFNLFHYVKRAPTTREEKTEQYNRLSGILPRKRGDLGNHTDPYTWLAPDDPCRFQSDMQILYEKIDLS